jgi:protein O-GlcNAcase/histone acetyltransferase
MQRADFLSGVVEGFYGKPWSHCDRLQLIEQLSALELKTYFYAPKNDLKHRTVWRELYNDTELARFRELVRQSDRLAVNLIYGLSPGLDVRFSEQAERNCIKARFEQLRAIGVRHFALLFDDLPGRMNESDNRAYDSLAEAQCDLTNEIIAWLRGNQHDARLLFCPTPYCDRMDHNQLGGPNYLDDVGRLLNHEIDIFWTGPEIISEEIPLASIQLLSRRLQRQPVIWDNLFANDYDIRRLYCGPYSGRLPELRSAVRGILINPNNEYAINFIPLRTFASFMKCDGEWHPREAFLLAASEWLSHFKSAFGSLTQDDLLLLTDCFYLPHGEGQEATTLLALIKRLLAEPVATWGNAHEKFVATCAQIHRIFECLNGLFDRELLAAWGQHIWELKETLLLIESVIAQKGAGRDLRTGMKLVECLPGTCRGGTLAMLERLLTVDSHGFVHINSLSLLDSSPYEHDNS